MQVALMRNGVSKDKKIFIVKSMLRAAEFLLIESNTLSVYVQEYH